MARVLDGAAEDIGAALRMRKVWIALAAEDVGDQHRRTTLGPLWLLINYLAFAGTFIFVFGHGTGTLNYPAYVATGLLVWLFISETITQSISLFVREESFIKGTKLPLSAYVLRLAMQSTIRIGYAAVGCLAILFLSGAVPTAAWLWSALALALIVATAPAAIAVAAFAGAYFPDLQFVVSNLMRLGMFLTPVFWVHTGGGGARSAFYHYNPFTYFLEIVRIPIVSGDVPVRSLLLCAALSLLLWALAVVLIGKYRKKVVFLV